MNRPTRSWLPATLFGAHLAALVFGLIGILVMLPHPDLWSGDPNAVRVFDWSMKHAGATHILFGAATMLAVGIVAIGWRKTLVFFAVSTLLSLSSELIGTGTGWPFGNYEYTNFLGTKVLGRVPYTIPLSWFYVGFAAYLIASAATRLIGTKHVAAWTVGIGTWLLTVWDLVLDPAMAHHSLRIQFWIWDETGPYFGMPVKNFVGWSLTGLLFMAISRAIWREDLDPAAFSIRIPLLVYAANLAFAIVLSAGVGLWLPILLAIVLGLIPAAAVLWLQRRQPAPTLRLSPDA